MASLQEKVDKANAALEAKRAAPSAEIPKGPPSTTAQQFGLIYLRGVAADPTRPKRWVEMSHHLMGDKDDPHIGFQLQQCGFLDTLLVAFESEQRTNPGDDPGNLYIFGQAFEFVLGDCWLLFTYEVLRTFRSSVQFATLPEVQRDQLNEIFRLVSLARMPVAKHEAAKTRKGKSYVFNAPIHIFHDGLGSAGWRVFDESSGEIVDILRRPLADALLLCADGSLSNAELNAICTDGSRELIRIVKT